jgi:hypothetical protein
MPRSKLSIRVLTLTLGVGLALAAPGVASACIPPLPMTAAEQTAADRAMQERLWANADQVFTATVTRVELEPGSRPMSPEGGPMPPPPGQARIRVELRPLLALKGAQGALPPSVAFGDVFVGCAPRGIARARVDEVYVVYAANAAMNTPVAAVPLAEIKDPVTLAAWEAAGR